MSYLTSNQPRTSVSTFADLIRNKTILSSLNY
jgi:hypothetical protein